MKKQILIAVFILFIICSTIVARSSPLHYLSFLSSEDSQMKQEINNTLDYMMKNSQDYLSDPMLLSLWVMSKSFLGHYDNRTEVIDYFNSRQESDGAWSGAGGRMFTTHRVLLAYFFLNATPAQNLDTFSSNYDTWSEAKNYMINTGHGDERNLYHIIFAWVLYYHNYPPWMSDFFNEVEKDLSWTTTSDFHKRTHILYSYVIARHPFPNLDSIIDATLSEQKSDGHWEQPSMGNRLVYLTSIQVTLLSQILRLYPNHRTSEIMASLDKAKVWVEDAYHTEVLDGSSCGYFGDLLTIEDAIFAGILCAGQTGLMTANIDMTFQDLYSKIIRPSPSPSPTPSPTPSPSPVPSPSPSLSPSPSASSSQQPIPTQKPQTTPSPPAEIIYLAAVAISTAVIATLTLLLRRRRRAWLFRN